MANGTELRGIALEILLEITQEKEYSHLAIRNALNKVQYLPKQYRAFINRLVEGTLEYMLRIDYVLNQFSSVRVNKMKPVKSSETVRVSVEIYGSDSRLRCLQ